jgi:hypothetical protein
MGSGFDDWVYWHFFAITVEYNSWHLELLLNDVCLMNFSEESRTDLWISRIHECIASYNFQAAGIEVIMSNTSSVLLCCHGNVFVNIRCCGNKCWPSRCLAKMTSASAIFLAFRQCLPSRCLANGHIPSQYVTTFSYQYQVVLSVKCPVSYKGWEMKWQEVGET